MHYKIHKSSYYYNNIHIFVYARSHICYVGVSQTSAKIFSRFNETIIVLKKKRSYYGIVYLDNITDLDRKFTEN